MAEARKVSNVTVNDGGGLYDNEGLIDTIIVDLNDILKNMAAGQYIRICNLVVGMTQKLTNLKKNMKEELAARDQQVADLFNLNKELERKLNGLPEDIEDDTEEAEK
jgi:phosphopantothenate synthetase